MAATIMSLLFSWVKLHNLLPLVSYLVEIKFLSCTLHESAPKAPEEQPSSSNRRFSTPLLVRASLVLVV